MPFFAFLTFRSGLKHKNYGKTWNCPPHTPTLKKIKKRIRNKKHHFLLIGREELDNKNWEDSKEQYAKLVQTINNIIRDLKNKWPNILFFHGPSCRYCLDTGIGKCTCPSEPCRFPDVWTYPPEAIGINVFQTMENTGFEMQKNPREVVYRVGLICLSEQPPVPSFTNYMSRFLNSS